MVVHFRKICVHLAMGCSAKSIILPAFLKLSLSLVLMLWIGICRAQFYPAPTYVDPALKSILVSEIQEGRHDKSEVQCLLQLSSIYYYSPLRKKEDQDKALALTQEAERLSTELHDDADLGNVRFYKAEMLIEERNMDEAVAVLDQLDDTTRLKVLLNLSNYNDDNSSSFPGYAAKAEAYAHQALDLATKFGLKQYADIARLNLANSIKQSSNDAGCEQILKQLFNDSSIKDKKLLRYAYMTQSDIYLDEGEYDKGLTYALKAMGTISTSMDSLMLGDCYLQLSYCYYLTENHDLNLESAKKAIEAYGIFPGEGRIVDALNYAIPPLTKTKRYAQAQQLLEDVSKRFPPQNDYDKRELMGSWGYFYKGEKKYALAEPYYQEILKTAEASHQIDESVYRNMGDVLVQDHKYAEAKPYLVKALNFPGGEPVLKYKSLVYYYLFLCDSAAGNYQPAIRELSIANDLNNQIKDNTKNELIQTLQVQYETKQAQGELKLKDQKIQLLDRTNQFQKADLARSQLVKKGTLAGIAILMVLLLVSVGYYRQKQLANRLITQNNQMITQKNQQLEQLLVDKDWLLKEVHHRVKNNLHTIICLLESQAAFLQNDALAAIESSQHRIYAMSLIHQKLYQSSDIRSIDMSIYLREFLLYLKESFGSPTHIHFIQEIEAIRLDLSQAIPLALIVNEAVTNAMKYAFPKQRTGTILISLHEVDDKIILQIQDNGIGMPTEVASDSAPSLGISLIRGLTEDLKGNVQFIIEDGTCIIISFKRLLIQ
jgi:two-component system, sensor histidine kinase PdtaS